MPTRKPPRSDFDSPWKEGLEYFLAQCLALLYPHIHADIDWSRGYRSLDKELQQLTRDARMPKGLADKLFQVWLKDGKETWLLIHAEVQGEPEVEFPQRMFGYNIRAFLRYNRMVVSLAVLTDDRPDWRPDQFAYGKWGASTGIRFLPVKLLDFRGRQAELEGSSNPFAQVVLAHLKALETRRDAQGRQRYKIKLVKGLYDRGWSAEDVRQLFRLLDWLLALPPELEEGFREEIYHWEEERRMPYVTSIERLALAKGHAEGLWSGIATSLLVKFGAAGKRLMPRIRKVQDVDHLQTLLDAIPEAQTPADIRRLLPR